MKISLHGREHRVRIKSTTEDAQDSLDNHADTAKKHSPSLLYRTSLHGDGVGCTGIGDLENKIVIVRHLESNFCSDLIYKLQMIPTMSLAANRKSAWLWTVRTEGPESGL
jgi:hypothetical protein